MYKLPDNQNNAYNDTIRGTSKQVLQVSVILGVSATDLVYDNTVTIDEPLAVIGSVEDVTDYTREIDKTYATLEPNLWLLDGNRVLAGENSVNDNLGVIFDELCDSIGDLASPPSLIITFDIPIDFFGLQIRWSRVLQEYAVDFDIISIFESGQAPVVENIRGNTAVEFQSNATFDKIKAVQIKVLRWSTPERRVRIEQVGFGIDLEYSNSNLISVSMQRDYNPLSLQLPTNTFNFVIIDTSDSFNADNPEGKYRFLIQNQRVKVQFKQNTSQGLIEIPGGNFYLSGWEQSDTDLEYSFVASDISALLDRTDYYKGINTKMSAYDLCQEIIADARLPNWALGQIIIDNSLQDIQLSALIPVVTHKDALQLIANACRCTISIDRDGKMIIAPNNDELLDYNIDNTLIYDNPPKPEWRSPLNSVVVSYSSINKTTNATTIEFEVDGDSIEQTKVIYYGNIGEFVSIKIASGTIVSYTAYAYAVEVKFNAPNPSVITVVYNAINAASSEVVLFNLDQYGQKQDGDILAIDNPLIDSIALANRVLQWAFNEATRRKIYNISMIKDARLDVGDVVSLDTKFIKGISTRVISIKTSVGAGDEIMEVQLRNI